MLFSTNSLLMKWRSLILKNLEHISPYWITGFADGEASFVIRIGKDKTKKNRFSD